MERKTREKDRKISLQSRFRERLQVYQGRADLEFFRLGFIVYFLNSYLFEL